MHEIPTNWLRSSAGRVPDVIAVSDERGEQVSYAELLEQAETLAGRIIAESDPAGISALELAPGLDHARAVHAALLAGRVFQTIRPELPAAERAAALEGLDEVLVIDAAWLAGPGGSGAHPGGDPHADMPATRVLTSGTSGARRGITHSYANHFWSAAASAHNLGVEPGDRWLCCIPTDHVGGLSILLRSVIYGTTAVVHKGFDADRVAVALSSGEANIVSLVPTQLRRLLDAGAAIERPRVILLGGARPPASLLEEALAAGANLVQTYGMTETASQVCTLAPADAKRKRGSVGRPLLNVELGLDNGEVIVAGPMVSRDSGALLRTGDLGYFDEEGFLWIEGRKDDLIISGGENVSPGEVEDVLRIHPGVADVAVVGREDQEWGQVVTAVVVPRGRAPTSEQLAEHCRDVLQGYKVPKRFEFTERLPRNAAGKLLRRELR